MRKLNRIWDFVEEYYPNYTGCSDIAYADDLSKILNNELTGSAEELFETMMDLNPSWISEEDAIDIIKIDVERKLDAMEYKILQKAIQGYIETVNKES